MSVSSIFPEGVSGSGTSSVYMLCPVVSLLAVPGDASNGAARPAIRRGAELVQGILIMMAFLGEFADLFVFLCMMSGALQHGPAPPAVRQSVVSDQGMCAHDP